MSALTTETVQNTAQEPEVAQSAPQAATEPIYSGSHEDWMAQAGIAQSDWGYVDYIISHESGWNPNATNASSGAHGLPQALPYSKTGCGWSDPVCQLRWANTYAVGRYGSWYGAYAFWLSSHWW